jgi:hypothetical protein
MRILLLAAYSSFLASSFRINCQSFRSTRYVFRHMMAEDSARTSCTKMKGEVEREIICSDAIAWLKSSSEPLNGSIFTSMPDISELNDMLRGYPDTGSRVVAYEEWFTDAAFSILSRLRDGAYAIFLQSDVRVVDKGNVVHWIDKSKLCSTAADKAGANVMWHKMTLNTNIDKKSVARPGYSHLIVSKNDLYHNIVCVYSVVQFNRI